MLRALIFIMYGVITPSLLVAWGCRAVRAADESVDSDAEGRSSDKETDSDADEPPATERESETIKVYTTDTREEQESESSEARATDTGDTGEGSDNTPISDRDTGKADTLDDRPASDHDSETVSSPDDSSEQETASNEDSEPLREGDPCDPEGEGAYCNDDNMVINLDNGWLDESMGDAFTCEPEITSCDSLEPPFCAGPDSGYENAVFAGVFVCNDQNPDNVHCERTEDVLMDDCEVPGERYCGEEEHEFQLLEADLRECVEDDRHTRCEPISFHVAEDCPSKTQICDHSEDEKAYCRDVDPCYFLERDAVCDTGIDRHCGIGSDGEFIVYREGLCRLEEMMILTCRADTEPCPENTNCILDTSHLDAGVASCL